MKCVILQPSYIPWRGYFHQIEKADIFIFYDDIQYDHLGWRNRNQIKVPAGKKWLTIPVYKKGVHTNQTSIDKVRICWNQPWNMKHLETIRHAYRKAPYYHRYIPLLNDIYHQKPEFLADFTIHYTISIARDLGIHKTKFLRSSELSLKETGRMERILEVLKKVGATHYISGPSAKDYFQEEKLAKTGITLEYMNYDYPEYRQLYPPFDPHVSILDLLFMHGSEAGQFIWQRQLAHA